jgi:hypothetical protein
MRQHNLETWSEKSQGSVRAVVAVSLASFPSRGLAVTFVGILVGILGR